MPLHLVEQVTTEVRLASKRMFTGPFSTKKAALKKDNNEKNAKYFLSGAVGSCRVF